MEHPAGHGQQAARMARVQRIYLSHLVVMLRPGRMDQRANCLSARCHARCQAVKLAADLSLAMTARGRTAWRRAIFRKYLFRLRKSRCQRRLADFRENSQRKRRLASAKTRPCKPNAPCDNSRMQITKEESRLTGTKRVRSRDDCDEVAGGIMGSRIQTLRLLVPGSGGLDTPVLLKETADYIVALKMQVQAMQALVECYSNSNANASQCLTMPLFKVVRPNAVTEVLHAAGVTECVSVSGKIEYITQCKGWSSSNHILDVVWNMRICGRRFTLS